MMLTFYCHPRCSTCNKAEKWLKENNVEYQWVDLTEEAPDKELLKKMLENSDRTVKSFFNTSGKVYRERGLKDKIDDLSIDELAALLASDGMLVKRPFMTDGEQATSGFKEQLYETMWKGK